MRRVLLLTTLSALATACSSGSGEPPLPSNPEDAASVVAAARDCNVADFSDGPRVTTLQGEVDIDEAATASQRNSAASEAYLTQMASQPCVYALPSGLMIRVIEAQGDDMPSPDSGEMVRAHYDGRFPTGDTFDSSYDRGEPLEYPSNRFIAGWNEALGYMRVGETWELFIPANLAYGPGGTPGGPIGPSQALMFEMELLCLPARTEPSCEALESERAD
tara:strand:- start:18030 stop:18686 length:657 start_codon:yes stop_codon:yes gene_type:complete